MEDAYFNEEESWSQPTAKMEEAWKTSLKSNDISVRAQYNV